MPMLSDLGWQFQVLVTDFHRDLRPYELLSQLLIMYSFDISGGRRKKIRYSITGLFAMPLLY